MADAYPQQHHLQQIYHLQQPQASLFVDNTPHPLTYMSGLHSYVIEHAQPTYYGQQVSYVNAPQAFYVGSPAPTVMHRSLGSSQSLTYVPDLTQQRGPESSQSLAYVAAPCHSSVQDGEESPKPVTYAMDGQQVYYSEHHAGGGYFTAEGHPVHFYTEGQPVASGDMPANTYYLPYVTEEESCVDTNASNCVASNMENQPQPTWPATIHHDLSTEGFDVIQAGDEDDVDPEETAALTISPAEVHSMTHVSQPHVSYTTCETFAHSLQSTPGLSVAPPQYVTQSELPADAYPARGRKVYNVSPEQFEILCSGSADANALARFLEEHPEGNVDASFGQMLCHQAFVAASSEQLEEETELSKLEEESETAEAAVFTELSARHEEAAVFTELSALSVPNPVFSEARMAVETQIPEEMEVTEESKTGVEEAKLVELTPCKESAAVDVPPTEEAVSAPSAAAAAAEKTEAEEDAAAPAEQKQCEQETAEEMVILAPADAPEEEEERKVDKEDEVVATAAMNEVAAEQTESSALIAEVGAAAAAVEGSSADEVAVPSQLGAKAQTAVATEQSAQSSSSRKAAPRSVPSRLKASSRPMLKRRSCC